jgi:tRNA A37 threonylcarbamoyladenosine synthetase subunit TsaC/SUA5/YrdC
MAHIIPISLPGAAQIAVEMLDRGDLIVLPTDTVYGVGSRIEATAIDRIFAAKQRPPERAVPVLLADIDAVPLVARVFPETARRLAESFWPGPLTLALPKRDNLPANLTHFPTVGVRVPDHAEARAVIAAAGGALAVTSANRSDPLPGGCGRAVSRRRHESRWHALDRRHLRRRRAARRARGADQRGPTARGPGVTRSGSRIHPQVR